MNDFKVSTSNVCLPIVDKSTLSSGQMLYSWRLLLISKILFVMPSGAGPGRTNLQVSMCNNVCFFFYIL